MTATSHSRGHPVFWEDERWIYVDNKKSVDHNRKCFKCGEPPTSEGYDSCLGFIEGAVSACCGHGKENPYTMWKGIRGWPQQIRVALSNIWNRIIYNFKEFAVMIPNKKRCEGNLSFEALYQRFSFV